MRPTRTHYRLLFLGVIIVFSLPILSAYSTAGNPSGRAVPADVPLRDNATVIVGDAHGPGFIAAYTPSGDLLYYNDTYERYHDVDPTPPGELTVSYVANQFVEKTACSSQVGCMRSVVEEVNLTTGEVTRTYSQVRPARGSSDVHDVDRLGPSRLLIAEIAQPDGVRIVNTATGVIEWGWLAQREFPRSGGGKYPGDWTHLNDVESLPDGRIMASLRNQDQVVFIDRQEGLQEQWTLGAEDAHDILYEQHNPDYIPPERGGPAVVVADSENSRLVEYQRVDGDWEQSWVWKDLRLQWPRDADRLPNGHTLITDTNGDRVVEVDSEGEVVWSVDAAGPYEAERLGTGDESAGGPSAASVGVESRTVADRVDGGDTASGKPLTARVLGELRALLFGVKEALPSLLLNGILFVLPTWMSATEVLALLGILSTGLGWGFAELWWSPYGVELETPVRITK